ncbi:DUF6881 domain-containing protein [Streptomyces cinnamoneus]|uniref:DUF6881 domain-containing protein n=1 Tax=Streptomyces cinnamoneus TaxID=53446 RepID=UPI0037A7D9CF
MERTDVEYWNVAWHHDYPEEPITLLSEVGRDGYETRKVAKFRDGTALKADASHEGRMIGLGEIPVGNIKEVDSQPDFSAHLISREDFEEAWNQAAWPQRPN